MLLRKNNIHFFIFGLFYLLYLLIGASIFSAIEGPEENMFLKELKEERMDFLNEHKRCISVYMIYLCIGATVFSLIEAPLEQDLKSELKTLRSAILGDGTCLTDAALEEFIEKIVNAANRGVYAVRNVTASNPNWSFGQSLFFAGTVITTIGYGRVTPLSEVGKGFCILYAVLGIPLTLVMFTAIVERLLVPTMWLREYMARQLGHRYKPLYIHLMHLSLLICIVVIFFYLIPAGIYSGLEPKWNYLDAFYYCFISLTTIGLGDYIPGDSPDQQLRPLYKVATTIYLFMGLIMMMLIFDVLYEIPELNIGLHFYVSSDKDDEERAKLQPNTGSSGLKYTKQIDEEPITPSDHSGIGLPSLPVPNTS